MQISVVKIEEFAGILAGAALIVRLATLDLHRVYRVFCLYLAVDVAITIYALVASYSAQRFYFYAWIVSKIVCWILYPLIVYNLLDSILASFPGILSFSQRLITRVFILAGIFSGLSVMPEYRAGGIKGVLGATLVIDRTMCTLEFLVLASILTFLLWFSVQIPRNLANLSAGFLIYFAGKSFLLLSQSYISHASYALVGKITSLLATACFLYWTWAISVKGEAVPVRIGHKLRLTNPEFHARQLDMMNAALLRSARR